MRQTNQPVAIGADTERRSTASGMEVGQLSLWPDQAVGGGSAGRGRALAGGGGYQHTCTVLPVSKATRGRKAAAGGERDPRINDLRTARIGPVWIKVAERIGFEAFMQVWQTLANFPGVGDDRSRVYVPCIEKFLAAQRHLLMRELIAQGLNRQQIRQELIQRLGAAPAPETIDKAIARVRSAA